MAYETTIYNPENGIKSISSDIAKFDCDRFKYALQYKNFDEADIERMSKQVADYREKLEKEHNRLLEFAKTFNKKFVTENNQCYDTALKLLRKLRSGISEVKRIYLCFCPRQKKNRRGYQNLPQKKLSAFDYSYFCTDSYQLTFFDLDEVYPPCVQGLYRELGKFFALLSTSLNLCMRVMHDEETIRQDPKYCNYLLSEFKKKVMKEFTDIADTLCLIPEDAAPLSAAGNAAIASWERYSGTEAWAPYGFHKYTIPEVKNLLLKELIEETRQSDLNKEEIVLFGNDPDKVHRIRNIILHFDQLMPEQSSRQSLEAKLIAMFMRWCGTDAEKKFVEYFNHRYESNRDRAYKVVQKNAVNAAKNKLLKEDKDNTEYNQFADKLDKMFFVPSIQQNMVS